MTLKCRLHTDPHLYTHICPQAGNWSFFPPSAFPCVCQKAVSSTVCPPLIPPSPPPPTTGGTTEALKLRAANSKMLITSVSTSTWGQSEALRALTLSWKVQTWASSAQMRPCVTCWCRIWALGDWMGALRSC